MDPISPEAINLMFTRSAMLAAAADAMISKVVKCRNEYEEADKAFSAACDGIDRRLRSGEPSWDESMETAIGRFHDAGARREEAFAAYQAAMKDMEIVTLTDLYTPLFEWVEAAAADLSADEWAESGEFFRDVQDLKAAVEADDIQAARAVMSKIELSAAQNAAEVYS